MSIKIVSTKKPVSSHHSPLLVSSVPQRFMDRVLIVSRAEMAARIREGRVKYPLPRTPKAADFVFRNLRACSHALSGWYRIEARQPKMKKKVVGKK